MTDAQIKVAARELCRLRGENPDRHFAMDGPSHGGDYLWERAAEDIRDHLRIDGLIQGDAARTAISSLLRACQSFIRTMREEPADLIGAFLPLALNEAENAVAAYLALDRRSAYHPGDADQPTAAVEAKP